MNKFLRTNIKQVKLQVSREKIMYQAPVLGYLGVFFLAVSLAIVIFTYENSRYSYSIFNHFISELGHTVDSPFYIVFGAGLCIASIFNIVLVMGLAYYLDNKWSIWAMRIGIFSGLSGFAVGLLPGDLYKIYHLIAALMFFFGSLVTVTLFAFAIHKDGDNKVPKWYIIPSLVMVVVSVVFLSLPKGEVQKFLANREIFQRPSLWLVPFFEWLVLITLMLWMILIANTLMRFRREGAGAKTEK